MGDFRKLMRLLSFRRLVARAAAVLLVYVGRYLPKAIKDIKKELGE